MFIDDYYCEVHGNIRFTRQQGSDFAKRIADDFNPLHDADARRFCVPGDLLFAVVLARYGVSSHMDFVFSDMVVDGVELIFPAPAPQLRICDTAGREYLRVARTGDVSKAEALVQNLIRSYVSFSGHTFPHILQPLFAERKVMLNPARPMVIYESMSIDLDSVDLDAPEVAFDHNELEIDGRRGALVLAFNFLEAGRVVGRGRKRMLLSGLRAYDDAAMVAAVDEYNQRKRSFLGA